MRENNGQAGDTLRIYPQMTAAEVRAMLQFLPRLDDLRVPSGILEVAAEIVDASDVPGLESSAFELLVRLLISCG